MNFVANHDVYRCFCSGGLVNFFFSVDVNATKMALRLTVLLCDSTTAFPSKYINNKKLINTIRDRICNLLIESLDLALKKCKLVQNETFTPLVSQCTRF
jgi:hypothetical protein